MVQNVLKVVIGVMFVIPGGVFAQGLVEYGGGANIEVGIHESNRKIGLGSDAMLSLGAECVMHKGEQSSRCPDFAIIQRVPDLFETGISKYLDMSSQMRSLGSFINKNKLKYLADAHDNTSIRIIVRGLESVAGLIEPGMLEGHDDDLDALLGISKQLIMTKREVGSQKRKKVIIKPGGQLEIGVYANFDVKTLGAFSDSVYDGVSLDLPFKVVLRIEGGGLLQGLERYRDKNEIGQKSLKANLYGFIEIDLTQGMPYLLRKIHDQFFLKLSGIESASLVDVTSLISAFPENFLEKIPQVAGEEKKYEILSLDSNVTEKLALWAQKFIPPGVTKNAQKMATIAMNAAPYAGRVVEGGQLAMYIRSFAKLLKSPAGGGSFFWRNVAGW